MTDPPMGVDVNRGAVGVITGPRADPEGELFGGRSDEGLGVVVPCELLEVQVGLGEIVHEFPEERKEVDAPSLPWPPMVLVGRSDIEALPAPSPKEFPFPEHDFFWKCFG